jgi:crotonobetainyl-CoA:carnitine CoA-transferase CaiB-like acyl-CoA transferase
LGHRDALNAQISKRVAEKPVAHWLDVLGTAGISCGRVNGLAEALALPVVVERRLLDSMQLRLPIDLSGSPVRRDPPTLGEHSREVLQQAGFDTRSIIKLGID